VPSQRHLRSSKSAPLLLLGLVALGCPSRGKGGETPGTGNAECSVRLSPAPVLEPAPELPAPRSHLGVEVSAELDAIRRELERQVPVGLAGERRRPIGAPGEVTYSVSRGSMTAKLVGDRLVVGVPVAVHVEVCKPLGPFCPVYGECEPRLSAVASLPAMLGADYEIGKSRVGVQVTRGCTIAGINATPEIEKRARGAVGIVQAKIDSGTPPIRPAVAAIWELLHHPVSLGKSGCWRIHPEHTAQAKPIAEPGRVVTRFAAEGTLSLEDPCLDPDAPVKAPPLPPLETRAQVPEGVDLRVPIITSWTDVSTALARSLLDPVLAAGGAKLVGIEAQGTLSQGRGVVALRGRIAGITCGDVVWLADAWFDPKLERVRFRNLRATTPAPSLDALAAQIEEQAAVPLPVDVSAGPAAIQGLIRSFGEGLPESVRVESALSPASVSDVRAASSGLVAVGEFTGSAAVRLR